MSKPRKPPIGRPKGATRKQRMAKALIAEGVQPLEAFTRAGFAYPGRELKRQAASVAEAQGCSPIETLLNIAEFGEPSDVVAACTGLLAHPDSSDPTSSAVVPTLHIVPPNPANLGLVPEGRDVFDTVQQAVDAWFESRESTRLTGADNPANYARARLSALLADKNAVKYQTLVAAAKALLRDNRPPEAEATTASDTSVAAFLIPFNGRGPIPQGSVLVVRSLTPTAARVQT